MGIGISLQGWVFIMVVPAGFGEGEWRSSLGVAKGGVGR